MKILWLVVSVTYDQILLTIPFVAEIVDLVGKSGQILVGSAFIVADHKHQAASCIEQTFKDCRQLYAALLSSV